MTSEFDNLFQRPQQPSWAQRLGDASPSPSPEPPLADTPDGSYKAWGFTPSDDQDGCDVRWWLTAEVPQGLEFDYRFMQRIGWIGDEQLHVFLSDCLIAIEGRGLLELRKKLARKRVTFIQTYHPLIWPKPPDSLPMISKVTVLDPSDREGATKA